MLTFAASGFARRPIHPFSSAKAAMTVGAALVLAFGLSMDSFAAALARGSACRRPGLSEAWRVGFAFATVQLAMPLLGWSIGRAFAGPLTEFGPWIACGVLVAIGILMMRNAVAQESEAPPARQELLLLLGTALSTSLDALAIGVGLAFTDAQVVVVVLLVGGVTFLAGFSGVLIGQAFNRLLGRWAEFVGGGTLVGVGFRLVLEHASS